MNNQPSKIQSCAHFSPYGSGINQAGYAMLDAYKDKCCWCEIEQLRSAFDDRVRVIELQLQDKARLREALKVYGGHIEYCKRRPCTCGWENVWNEITAPVVLSVEG